MLGSFFYFIDLIVLAGESIEAEGRWAHYKDHGLQFKAIQRRIISPTGLEGIEKYLSPGLGKGIAP